MESFNLYLFSTLTLNKISLEIERIYISIWGEQLVMKTFHFDKINWSSRVNFGASVYLLRVQVLTRPWRVFLAEVSTTRQNSQLPDSSSGSTAEMLLPKFWILTIIRHRWLWHQCLDLKSNLNFRFFSQLLL